MSEAKDLRTALQYAVAQICTEQELNAGAEMSSGAIQALSELAFQYATTSLSNDLQAFASHANRKQIKADDVMLIARKSDTLKEQLRIFSESRRLTPTKKRPQSAETSKSLIADISCASTTDTVSFRETLIRNMDSTQESDEHCLKSAASKHCDSSTSSDAEFEKENQLTQKMRNQRVAMADILSDDEKSKPLMKRLKLMPRPRKQQAVVADLTDTDESE